MRVKENVTIYQCDFCNRKMFRKHSMEKHEKWCDHNPQNFRACGSCQFLDETVVYYSYDKGLGEVNKKTNGFRCSKLNKDIYPFKAEKLDLPNKYPETFDGQEPMPKSCDSRKFWSTDFPVF